MNNATIRKLSVKQEDKILIQKDGVTYTVSPKQQEICVLRNMSEEERCLQIQINPYFLALDLDNYKDKLYARNLCRIYVEVAGVAVTSISSIKKFHLADLEKALSKLKKANFSEYRLLCSNFSINPDKKKCTNPIINLDIKDNTPLFRLASWGYADIFVTNVVEAIPKILAKTYSKSNISDTERIKLAHIFFNFIVGFNNMPYDEPTFEVSIAETAKANASALTAKDKQMVIDNAMDKLLQGEKSASLDAITLEYAYREYFSKLPDGSINLDMVKQFLYKIIGTEYRLQILNFFKMLSAEERSEFIENKVQRISNIFDIRTVKEKIFRNGPWASGLNCFMTNADEKSKSAMQTALKKFEKENWQFGKNVQGYKVPKTVKLYATGREAKAYGYMYAEKPVRLRISDQNELRMIKFFLTSDL